jgi:hypothetical protein
VIVAPGGRLSRVLVFTFANARITRLEAIGDRDRLRALDLAVLS